MEDLKDLHQLQGPEKYVSQYSVKYARVANAYNKYFRKIANIYDLILELREMVEAEGEVFDDKKEFSEITYDLTDAISELQRSLMFATSWENDLENYAYALLEDWKESGGIGNLL